jgi:hypothetical protein
VVVIQCFDHVGGDIYGLQHVHPAALKLLHQDRQLCQLFIAEICE